MTIHLGDEFSRQHARYDKAWRPETQTTPRLSKAPGEDGQNALPKNTRPCQNLQDPDSAAADATNMAMYENQIIQPEDL